MKKHDKTQLSEEANTYNLLAGTIDFFIKDMEADQESSGDKNLYKEYLSNARQMKGKLNMMSKILKKS